MGVAPGWPRARTATAHRLLGCGCAGERGGGWRRAALAAVAVPLEVEEELEYAALALIERALQEDGHHMRAFSDPREQVYLR